MAEKETMQFDAEVEKLFKLVIHSLYQNRDIFLRELISNASDACDKLRYKALDKQELLGDDPELAITVTVDKDAGTLTIRDNGIGMTRKEIVDNLGTIARSGTERFMDRLTGDKKQDAQLIGQFGVGFYSAFMVANKVQVLSRAAGKKQAVKWISEGKANFTVEETDAMEGRGTEITLFMNDESKEYLDKHRLEHIIKTYSNHVAFPITFVDDLGDNHRLNDGKALWTRPKSELTQAEYNEFYQDIAHMGADEPWMTLHTRAEGALEYTSLLFIPSRRPFDLFHPDRSTQVKLYIKRVFIAEEGLDIIPSYLRFLRGVVDSEDLPLNISRETVQNNVLVQKIRRAVTKKVLNELTKKADKQPEAFAEFWENFGPVLKEGLCDQMEPREDLLKATRFRTTKSGDELVSFETYIKRMQKDQKAIYYITGENHEDTVQSPQLEGFKDRDIEVILLTDSVDEFWVNVVPEVSGTPLRSITRSSKELDEEFADTGEKEPAKDANKEEKSAGNEALIQFFKTTLGAAIADVRTTQRLKDSPVCLSAAEGHMDIRMERFMIENKQLPSSSAKLLEINPNHPIIRQLAKDIAGDIPKAELEDRIHLLHAQANIIEGEPIKDIAGFTRRMNALLSKAA